MSNKGKIAIIFAGVLLFGGLGLKQVSAAVAPEVTSVVPTFFCLGPCVGDQPSPTVAELLPDEPTPLPTEIGQQATQTPVQATLTPAILQPAPRNRRPINRRRQNPGLVGRLIRIIEELLKRQQPQPGQPSPTPTPIQSGPTPEPNITQEPTQGIEPTEELEPTEEVGPTEEVEPTDQPEPTEIPQPDPDQTGGLLQRIIEMLQQLMDLIRQLLGQPPTGGGGGTPTVTPIPEEPTATPEPTQGQGQPTQAPTAVQPTTPANPTNGQTNPGDTTVPSTPTNLTVAASGNTAAKLTWTASTDNVRVTEYIVYRSQGNGSANTGINWNSKDQGRATITGTTFTDTNLTAGTTYYYYVRALDAAKNRSEHSNTVGITIKAAAPANNTLQGTVALSGLKSLVGKKITIKITSPENNLTKSQVQGNTANPDDVYKFTSLPNGQYSITVSCTTGCETTKYLNAAGQVTFSKSTGDAITTVKFTLPKK